MFSEIDLPQLLQHNESVLIITDPKGKLLSQTGTLLKKAGYRIKVLNTKHFANSMYFNPKEATKWKSTYNCNNWRKMHGIPMKRVKHMNVS